MFSMGPPGMRETSSDYWVPWIFGTTIVLAIIGFFVWSLYIMIEQVDRVNYVNPIYTHGQMVKMRAFGTKGMVVGYRCPHLKNGGTCTYSIRFPAIQMLTDTHLFGSDGPISVAPVALVNGIEEFEIVSVQ